MKDTQSKRRGDKESERKEATLQVFTGVVRLQQIGRSPMYELLNVRVEFGIMKWVAGTILCSRLFSILNSRSEAKIS